MCIEYAGFLWALCPVLSCTAEDSTSFYSPGLKIVEQKLQIPHANWNFDAFSDPGPLPQTGRMLNLAARERMLVRSVTAAAVVSANP